MERKYAHYHTGLLSLHFEKGNMADAMWKIYLVVILSKYENE